MFGYDFRLHKTFAGDKEPVLSMHASGGVYWMTGYMPDTTVELMLKTPLGAPLLTGCETFASRPDSLSYASRVAA